MKPHFNLDIRFTDKYLRDQFDLNFEINRKLYLYTRSLNMWKEVNVLLMISAQKLYMPCEPLFDRLWFSFHLKYFKTYHQEHMFNLCTVILWCAIVTPYCDTQSLRTLYREWSNYNCTYFDDLVWKLIMIKLNSHPIISKLWENYLVIMRKNLI